MPFLKHFANGSPVGFIELIDSISIGRAENNDIVVADPTVSQRHVEILRDKEKWLLRDCGSTNGTLVLGERVNTCDLLPGVVFVFGTQSFEFCESIDVKDDKTLKIQKSWIPGIYFTK